MSKIKTLSAIICLTALTSSCEKELMTYEGKDNLYFDIRNEVAWIDPTLWSHEHFSTVSFGSTLDDEITLNLKIQASGMPSSIDRPFSIAVVKDSTDLHDGDFEGLASSYIIKAGETSTNVELTFHRKEHMKNDTLKLQLGLIENEYFSLMHKNFGKAPEQYASTSAPWFDYNHDATIHNIFVYDVMSRPARWQGNDANGLGTLGAFSAKKWLLMMELTGTTIDDFAQEATMPNQRMTAIAQTLSKYLLEKASAREPILEEDGTMMYCTGVNWSPFTKPEDFYK